MSSAVDWAITSCILVHIGFLTQLSESYSFVSLEKDSLCFSALPKTVTLGLNASSALIVSLPNTTSYKDLTMNWKEDFVCNFQVKTNSGLFAVIQTIVFRVNNSVLRPDGCLDYIQYGKNASKRKFCGAETITSPSAYSFIEPSGSLDVEIFISKVPLRPYRYLEIQVVFTSYRFCFLNFSVGDKPCSARHTAHCIYQGFFNDGYVNCPYNGCVDEPACPNNNVGFHSENGTLSFHIALTSVFVMVVACTLIACYLGNKFKKFCWNRSAPRTYQRPSAQDDPSCAQQSSIFVTEPPEAPPIYDSLPPSYSSLFPDK